MGIVFGISRTGNHDFDLFHIQVFELFFPIYGCAQRYTYRVLQTIQMKLILICVWAEPAILGSAKTDLKFKYEIQIG